MQEEIAGFSHNNITGSLLYMIYTGIHHEFVIYKERKDLELRSEHISESCLKGKN